MKMRRRELGFILFLTVLLVAIAGYEYLIPKKLHGEVIEPPKPMSDFTLASAQAPVTLSSFRGKVVVVYFGYTSCPDLCPTTLATLHQALAELGDKAKEVQVLFISVDWKRDTPEIMAKYVAHFNPNFIGLAGTQPEIDAVTKSFGIFYLLNLPDENGFYSVDHTASLRVLDRQGNLQVIWPYGIQSYEIAADLRALLKNSASTP
ncbi:MAG: SCO family protein [Chloroflexota bacterium]